MTIDEARDLFAYDRWGNRRLCEALESLPKDKTDGVVASSFPSLRKTLAHIVVAEWIWLRRWLGESPAGPPAEIEDADLTELREALAQVEAERDSFLGRLSDVDLDGPVRYRDTEGTTFEHRLGDLMRHVVNHSTYHRGQAATQLRQLDQVPPGTDLILYLRDEKG